MIWDPNHYGEWGRQFYHIYFSKEESTVKIIHVCITSNMIVRTLMASVQKI